MRVIIFFTFLVGALLAPVLFSRGFIANAGDMHLHYYPLKHYSTARIMSGELPLWNPYIFGGTPHLANPQAGVFYPGSLPFYFFGSFAAFKIWILIHLIFLSCSSYALYKFFIDDAVPSIAAAAAVSFSSFVIYNIPAGHAVMLAGFSWLPAVVLLAYRFAEGKDESLPFTAMAAVSAALAFQFLSGHPQGVFMSVLVVSALFASSGIRGLKRLAAVGALALGLSAAQYLPSLEFSSLAEKISWRPLARELSLRLSDFVSLAAPWRWGNPLDGNLSVSFTRFFERKNLFMGYSGLILAVAGFIFALKDSLSDSSTADVARVKFRVVSRAFALCGLFGLIMAFGFNAPGFGFIHARAPFLSSFRAPSRFYFLALASSGFFIAYAVSKFSRRPIRIALAAMVCAELLVWNQNFIRPMPLAWSASVSAGSTGKNERIFTTEELPANLAMMTRLQNLNGYDALILSSYFRNFYSVYEPARFGPSTFLAVSDNAELYSADFYGWGMKYIFTASDMAGARVPEAVFGNVRMFKKKKASGRIFTVPPSAGVTVSSVEYGHEKININISGAVEGGGALVLGESYYPGWRAWMDGAPVPVGRYSGVFRSVPAPRGSRRVTMAFMPGSLLAGVLMSVAAFALVVSSVAVSCFGFLRLSPSGILYSRTQ